MQRVVTWRVIESAGLETTWVTLDSSSLTARGRAVGMEPFPYWLEYELTTGNDYITCALDVIVHSATDTRTLELRHESGGWTANGDPLPNLSGAVDCDLGLCPLTNTMPILRHQLHVHPGRHEFLMAWIAVPDLDVRPSRQTYTHLGVDPRGTEVRYESGDFASDLLIDHDGLVVEYPQLATRIGG